MSEEWVKLLQRFQNASVKLGITSALRSHLAFCALITPLGCVFANMTSDRVIALGFLIVALIPVLATAVASVRLAFRNPDSLRTEDWQMREQIIQVMLQKGKPFPIDLTSLTSMANPERARLAQAHEIEPTKAEEIQ